MEGIRSVTVVTWLGQVQWSGVNGDLMDQDAAYRGCRTKASYTTKDGSTTETCHTALTSTVIMQ
jgi:hypothetical protein